MSDLEMMLELECKCGKILKIDTEKCDEYVCPKCGDIVFKKFESLEESTEYCKSRREGMAK